METNIMTDKENLQSSVKQYFKRLEFNEGLNLLLENCQTEDQKKRTKELIKKLEQKINLISSGNIKHTESDKSLSFSEYFYYQINKIIADALQILDQISSHNTDFIEDFDDFTISWDEIMTFKKRYVRKFFSQAIENKDYHKACEILLYNTDKQYLKDEIEIYIKQIQDLKTEFEKTGDINTFFFAINEILVKIFEIADKITSKSDDEKISFSLQSKEDFKQYFIRKTVKQKLKNRKYEEALRFLMKLADNKDIIAELGQKLKLYERIKKQKDEDKISSEEFYYAINRIVVDVLGLLDKITGTSDDDLNFLDELSSSLKFNLIDPNESNFIERKKFLAQNQVKNQSDPLLEAPFKQKGRGERLEKLYQQLSFYEQKEQKEKNPDRKAKINDIIQAIYYEIDKEENKKK